MQRLPAAPEIRQPRIKLKVAVQHLERAGCLASPLAFTPRALPYLQIHAGATATPSSLPRWWSTWRLSSTAHPLRPRCALRGYRWLGGNAWAMLG